MAVDVVAGNVLNYLGHRLQDVYCFHLGACNVVRKLLTSCGSLCYMCFVFKI